MDILQSVTTPIYFGITITFYTEVILPIYGSLVGAINYFGTRLRTQAWDDATKEERVKALHEATRLIDRLNFAGRKVSSDQPLQFPRNTDTETPTSVEVACYEIAYKLLDGYDPEFEAENIGSPSQGFENVRTTYDRSFVLEHLRAGIPSAVAWSYLKPFLIDPLQIRISRV